MAEQDQSPNDQLFEPERQEEFNRLREDFAGVTRSDLWRLGTRDFLRLPFSVDAEWRPVGPSDYQVHVVGQQQHGGAEGIGNISGEVTKIVIDPRNPTAQVFYVATNNGGVWKTTTGGVRAGNSAAWSATMDSMESLSMGALALDPDDSSILYAGTGNPFDGGSQFNTGVGIYKSVDAGRTWTITDGGLLATTLTALIISDIVVPQHDVVLVATGKGIFCSQDGALNFGANAGAFNDSKPVLAGNITSLLVDPSMNPPHVYAGVSGKGVFRSQDGGRTFPEHLFDPGGDSYGLIALSLVPSDPPGHPTIAASIGAPASGKPYRGLFLSSDGGAHWRELPDLKQKYIASLSTGTTGQTTYDVTVGIDPQNTQLIYAGFENLFQTNNAEVFTRIATGLVHTDHHAVVFSPREHWGLGRPGITRVFVGTDGGIYFSDDGGANWTDLNQDLATVLLESIDMGRGSDDNRAWIYGGSQDNGTGVHSAGAPAGQWLLAGGGDGGVVSVSPSNPQRAYGTVTGTFEIASFDSFRNQVSFGFFDEPKGDLPPVDPHNAATWVNLIAVDSGNDQIVYVTVTDTILKSVNGGHTFSKQKTFPGRVSALETGEASLVWVGTEAGDLFRSTNGGSDWDKFSTGVTRSVEDIAIDPLTSDRVAVVYSGYSLTNSHYPTQHVYLTSNGGTDWQDISGTPEETLGTNLPDVPCLSVVFDGQDVVVGADGGVARTVSITAAGASWQQAATGLPRGSCMSLAIDRTATTALLRVGTYGRSCFERTASINARALVVGRLAFDPVLVGSDATLAIEVCNPGSQVLNISSFAATPASSTDFHTDFPTPVDLPANSHTSISVKYTPTAAGTAGAAEFVLTTNDPAQPTISVFASGSALRTGNPPRLAIDGNLNFGQLGVRESRTLPFRLVNVGNSDLSITSIKQTDGDTDFAISPNVTLPTVIAAGLGLNLQMRFDSGHPLGFDGHRQATFEIASTDQRSPTKVNASGFGPPNKALTVVAIVVGIAIVGAIVAKPLEELLT